MEVLGPANCDTRTSFGGKPSAFGCYFDRHRPQAKTPLIRAVLCAPVTGADDGCHRPGRRLERAATGGCKLHSTACPVWIPGGCTSGVVLTSSLGAADLDSQCLKLLMRVHARYFAAAVRIRDRDVNDIAVSQWVIFQPVEMIVCIALPLHHTADCKQCTVWLVTRANNGPTERAARRRARVSKRDAIQCDLK